LLLADKDAVLRPHGGKRRSHSNGYPIVFEKEQPICSQTSECLPHFISRNTRILRQGNGKRDRSKVLNRRWAVFIATHLSIVAIREIG
jgi:hypothetical protein